MPTPPYEEVRGKYRVSVAVGVPCIEARKEDSPFYVKQSIFIENTSDLIDLFIAIAKILSRIYKDDRFKIEEP